MVRELLHPIPLEEDGARCSGCGADVRAEPEALFAPSLLTPAPLLCLNQRHVQRGPRELLQVC